MTPDGAAALGEPVRQGAPVIDGMAFRFGGWSEDLGRSGITAIVATVDDFVSGYAETHARMCRILAAIERHSRLTLVREADDIERARSAGLVGIILAFQNANPIEDRISYLEDFHAMGLRCLQLTYNQTNRVGSGCLAETDGGLTRFGRDVVRALNDLGVVVDLSHCGKRTTLDAIALSSSPPVFSHAGAFAVTPNPRNKDDKEIQCLAEAGGVIGLSPYGPFCWDPERGVRPTLADLMRHVEYVVDMVGDEAVGFGGDWPVGITPSEHAEAKGRLAHDADAVIGDYNRLVGDSADLRYPSDMPSLAYAGRLPQALARAGHGAARVRRLIGGNFLRLFKAVWQ